MVDGNNRLVVDDDDGQSRKWESHETGGGEVVGGEGEGTRRVEKGRERDESRCARIMSVVSRSPITRTRKTDDGGVDESAPSEPLSAAAASCDLSLVPVVVVDIVSTASIARIRALARASGE